MAIIQVESGKLFTEQDIDGLTTRLQLKKLLAPYENFKKRRGVFCITSSVLEDRPDLVCRIMGMCVITRCEFLFHMDVLEYHALSLHFKVMQEGCVSPKYGIVVEKLSNGFEEIHFEQH